MITRDAIRATSQTGFATIFSFALRALTVKVFAVVTGPVGLGYLGVLRVVIAFCNALAALNSQPALIRGLSRRRGRARRRFFYAALAVLGVTSLAVGLVMATLGGTLTSLAYDDLPQAVLDAARFVWVPVIATTVAVSIIGMSSVQGRAKDIAVANTLAPIAMIVLAWPVAVLVEQGEFTVYVLFQAVSPLVILGYCLWSARTLVPFMPPRRSDFTANGATDAREFLSLTNWLFMSALVTAATDVAVRAEVIAAFEVAGLGIFEGAWFFASISLNLLTQSLAVYFRPYLSVRMSASDRAERINALIGFAVLLMLPASLGLIALKAIILELLLSDEFLDGVAIINWLLLGNFLRLFIWTLMTALIGDGRGRSVFAFDATFNAGFLVGVVLITSTWSDLEAVGAAFLATNVITLTVLLIYARMKMDFRPTVSVLFRSSVAFAALWAACALTWDAIVLDWTITPVLLLAACAVPWVLASKDERGMAIDLVWSVLARKRG